MSQKRIQPLKTAYEEFWVPIFGRILMLFVKWIEKKEPTQKPTYDLRDKKSQ